MTRPRYDLELLLDVAIEEFTKRGYDGTSIEHLSTATGLSKSSLYHHVEGKEHILRLGLERAVTPLLDLLDEQEAREGRAIDRLTYVLRRQIAILEDGGSIDQETRLFDPARGETRAMRSKEEATSILPSSPDYSPVPSTRSPSGTAPATDHSAPKPSPTRCSPPASPASAPER